MQTDIQSIKTEISRMDKKMDKVMVALMGSDLAKDGGLISRIAELEDDNEALRRELDAVKVTNQKIELYQKIIWALGGSIASGVFGYILKLIFEK